MVNQPNITKSQKNIAPLLGEKVSLKQKCTNILKEYWYLSLAFIIPAVIMYLIYVAMGIHPIGESSVLVLDLNGQYVSFYEGLRHFIYGDASLLYSFARALGGEFMGMYAYYLASPLSYIVALFPQDMILEALLVIFLLKTGFCGFTFGFYLHQTTKTNKNFNKVAVIAFAMMYALSAYCIVQQHNSMWIDAVMWLPIITYGIEELIKKGHFKTYVISLAISLMSNFYIGWMTCIYCAMYFIIYYFMHNENHRNNPYREKTHFARSFLRIAIFSVLALAIAAVILFTAYYSLTFGKTTFSNTNWELVMRFDVLDMLVKFLPSSYDTVRPEGLPFVYCGVLILLLVPVFFCSTRFSLREKILSGVFIAFFIFSFAINPVDIFWHGFQKPNWLNYRYSFMLCFFLLVIAYKGLLEIRRTSVRTLVFSSALVILFVGIVQKFDLVTYILGDGSNDRNHTVGKLLTLECVWLTVVLVLVYLLILCVIRRSNKRRNISLIMAIVVSIELFCNGLICCLDLGSDVVYTSYTSYHNNIDPLKATTSVIKESDKSFYRLEEITHRKANDNIALDVFGLTNSTSTLNATTIRFLRNMGYMGKAHESRYYAGNVLADSLLNMKYILAGEPDKGAEAQNDKIMLSDGKYYSIYYSDENYTTYENLYALSLAYAVSADVKDLDLGEYQNPYDRLNAIVTKMLGESETVEVFKPITDYTVNTSNITTSTAKPSATSNYKYAFTNYQKSDQTKDAYVKYIVTPPVINSDSSDGQQYIYFYLPSEFQRGFTLSTPGGSYGSCFAGDSVRSLYVGKLSEGVPATISLKLEANNLYVTQDVNLFYYLDYDVYVEVMNRLDDSLLKIDEGFSDDRIEGSITTNTDNATIFTSIPYDEGWQVWVDGKRVETYGILGDSTLEAKKSTGGALVAFDIAESGEHTVKFVYRPKAFTFGLTISIVGVIVFILLVVFEKAINRSMEKVFMPLTVKVRSEEELAAEDAEKAKEEAESAASQRVRIVPAATQIETPKGLDPAVPLRAMSFEEAKPTESIEPIDNTDQTNNGDTN